MGFHWVTSELSDPTVLKTVGLDQLFNTTDQAEAWLSSCYDELSAAGITEVSLLEDDKLVYGPMSLLP